MYDPDNPDSPAQGGLKVGAGMRVIVDGSPAWTGVLQTWGWDRASTIADLNGLDPIGMLAVRVLPAGQTLEVVPDGATTAEQAQHLLDLVEWPVEKRYFPDGASGVVRGNHYVEGPAIDGLHRIRFAELGRLFPMRDGRIGWHDRNGVAPPASSAIINCGGVGLTDMWKAMGLGRVRNRVVVSGGYGVYGDLLPPDQYRSVNTTALFLQMAYPGEPAPMPEDLWANTILDALEHPPVLTMLDTMVPVGAQVAQIVCSEFGARWTVKVTGQPDTVVQVFGMRVALAPGTIEVDVVTEDVVAPVPFAHVTKGAGSGGLTSTSTEGSPSISYAAARAGTALTVVSTALVVGQYTDGASAFEVDEAFLWFDTSSVPVGSTILEADFAAMVTPSYAPTPPQVNTDVVIEVRSGYAWRPTLTTADWRPGAGIAASYPLRASWNTANGINFQEFEDAGSGLAGAIVKGGATELIVVTARTVTGTPPVVNQFERISIANARLRITYTVP